MGVDTGATWRIQLVDLYGCGDACCYQRYCGHLFHFVLFTQASACNICCTVLHYTIQSFHTSYPLSVVHFFSIFSDLAMQPGSQKACRAHAHSWVRRRRINISRRERKRSNRTGASVVPTDRPQWRSNGVGRFTSGVTMEWAVWARGQGAPSAAAPELRTFF